MAGKSSWISDTSAFWAAGIVCAVLLTFGVGSALQVSADEPAGDHAWRQSAVWDDGNAEFAVYEVRWQRYGRLCDGRALLVAVKEPWAPDLDVKADTARARGFDVLKLNHIRDVATGIYTYHQMASAFVRRDSGSLEKLAAMSSEACGLSTALMQRGKLVTASYFDGQGQRETSWPTGAIAADSLPLALRDFVLGEAPAKVSVFPSLLTGKFPPLVAASYTLARRLEADVDVPAGRYRGVELVIAGGGETLSYTFEAKAPHVLLHYHHSDGTDYQLAKTERIPYWNMHDSGGESWLPERLRH